MCDGAFFHEVAASFVTVDVVVAVRIVMSFEMGNLTPKAGFLYWPSFR